MKKMLTGIIFMAFAMAITHDVGPAETFTAIQDAIDAAADGDTILVQPGTYNENLSLGKNLVLASLYLDDQDQTAIAETIIDGSGVGSAILISGVDDTAELVGFTITNGFALNGGGLFILDNSEIKLKYLLVAENDAYYSGGGVYVLNSTPTIINCTFTQNNATNGGSIFSLNSDTEIINTIAWDNAPQEIYFDEDAVSNNVSISYSLVSGGPGSIVTNGGTVDWTDGNLSDDPLFVTSGAGGDFHLQAASPCRNAGDPDLDGDLEDYNTDVDDQDPDGSRLDMGTYYFEETNGCTDPEAFNYDGQASNDDGSCVYAPLQDDFAIQLAEDSSIDVTLDETDNDGETLVYSMWSTPSNGAGSFLLNVLTYTPDADFNGNDSLQYRVNDGSTVDDGEPLWDTVSVSISVLPVNDAPIFTPIPNQTMDMNDQLTIPLVGSDVDGDTLYFVATTDNDEMTAETVGSSLTLTPTEGWGSIVTVDVICYDRDPDEIEPGSDYLTDETSFEVTVEPVGDYVELSIGDIDYVNHTVDIEYSSSVAVDGFQFELSVDVITVDDMDGGLAEDFGFITTVTNGIVLGYADAFNPSIPAGSSGTLTTLSYTQGAWAGGSTICIENIVVTTDTGTSANVSIGECEEYAIPGDTSQDGAVNVIDIVQVVSFILGNAAPTDFQIWASDINGDTEINVTDVVLMVSIIEGSVLKGLPATEARINQNSNRFSIDSDGDIAGIEVTYTGNFQLTDNYLPEQFAVQYNSHKLVIYGLDSSVNLNGDLFEYTGELNIVSGIAADWSGNSVLLGVDSVPNEFALEPAFPNPFNPVTHLNYTISRESDVTLVVYDILGQKTATLVDSRQPAGSYQISWDAGDLPSGMYFVHLTSDTQSSHQKIMLIK